MSATALSPAKAEPSSGFLSISELSVEFGGLRALDSVSMEVRDGEIVGLIGPNGAGKTTLFNAICGFIRPSSGSISYNGVALSKRRPHDLSKLGIARTLQGVGLCHGLSLLENVMLGAQARLHADFASAMLGIWRSSREELRLAQSAQSLLDELGIGQYAGRYPATLPYAIQKRAALARALNSEPTMLLLDEPASGLSDREMSELVALVRDLTKRMGVLIVEHHMDFVTSLCHRVIVLNFGRLIADGTPLEIRANREVTTAYLGEDVREVQDEAVADA
ncbi:MAG: ABC transporter ATP-binding protein [Acidimicrobiales bacterium]|jgi:branched-chain amino acid transport system ATP-binding protein